MTAPSAVLFYKKPKPDRRKCHMRGVSDNTDLWHPTLCRARVRDDIDTTPPLADDPAKARVFPGKFYWFEIDAFAFSFPSSCII